MWNQKLCMALGTQFGISYEEQLVLLKKTGFDGFFLEWNDKLDLSPIKKLADELGLIFQSIHAPYTKSNLMWKDDESAKSAKAELLACLEACRECNVPIMVCHAFIGFDEHSPNQNGIDNFSVIVDKAKEYNIKIAFENTEGEEYLFALMKEFRDRDNVGFCWDTGHEMCYNHSRDMLEFFGEKLICTHINDNLGIRDFQGNITWIDDLHLLPFDGIADWEDITTRLNRWGFDDILTFELNRVGKPDRYENNAYQKMSIEEYFAEAYKRACRVAALKMRKMK